MYLLQKKISVQRICRVLKPFKDATPNQSGTNYLAVSMTSRIYEICSMPSASFTKSSLMFCEALELRLNRNFNRRSDCELLRVYSRSR